MPDVNDDVLTGCRDFISVILYMKWNTIDPSRLIDSLNTSPEPTQNTGKPPVWWPGEGDLTPLQQQIVQPFIRHIYGVDAFFTKRDRQSEGMRVATTRTCIFTCAQVARYVDIEHQVKHNSSSAALCQRSCLDSLRDSRRISDHSDLQVPTRLAIPSAWEDIVTFIVLCLRNDLDI